MKLLKSLSGLAGLCFLLFFTQSNLSSCQKETIYDTVIVRDTVRIVDSVNCGCYNLKDGLIAYYNFNAGTLNDSSGNNNHIVFNNAVKTTDRNGKANNAYVFDGSSSYMKVNNSPSLNDVASGISMVATVKINDFYSGNCVTNQIFGKGYDDHVNGFYALRFGSIVGCGKPVDKTKELFNAAWGNELNRNSVGQPNIASEYLTTGQWYHVVYTYENGTSKIYVNGVLKNTAVQTPAVFTANSQELLIGKHGDPPYPYWFTGVIDEVRIYKKALCQGEVNQLYSLKD